MKLTVDVSIVFENRVKILFEYLLIKLIDIERQWPKKV